MMKLGVLWRLDKIMKFQVKNRRKKKKIDVEKNN